MSASWSVRFELFVADYQRSIDFYTGVLGFALEREHHDYVSLRHGGVVIGLGLIERLPECGDGPGFTRPRLRADRGGGVEIVLETPDVEAVHRAVLASGYPLAEPLTARPWGLRDFRIGDPDGYYLRITERDGTAQPSDDHG